MVAFSADGRLLAGVRPDGVGKLWGVATQRQLATLKGHKGFIFAAAFSPDGTLLATAGEEAVRLWEVPSGRERGVLRGHKEGIFCAAFAPDGKTLVTGSTD